MRVRVVIVLSVAMAVAAAACGKSAEQQAAEAAAKQLEHAAKSAEKGDTAKSLEEMGKALDALAGGGSTDQKPIEPVSFKALQTVFPKLEGWEMGTPTGERTGTPVAFSKAEVTYTKGESRIEARMVDSGFNQLLIAPLMMFMAQGYERETEDGYEKSAKVAGNPGWERWNKDTKSGEVSALVSKRFILTFQGENVDDTKVLYELAEKANYRDLPAK